eukprot:EG_transcript_829
MAPDTPKTVKWRQLHHMQTITVHEVLHALTPLQFTAAEGLFRQLGGPRLAWPQFRSFVQCLASFVADVEMLDLEDLFRDAQAVFLEMDNDGDGCVGWSDFQDYLLSSYIPQASATVDRGEPAFQHQTTIQLTHAGVRLHRSLAHRAKFYAEPDTLLLVQSSTVLHSRKAGSTLHLMAADDRRGYTAAETFEFDVALLDAELVPELSVAVAATSTALCIRPLPRLAPQESLHSEGHTKPYSCAVAASMQQLLWDPDTQWLFGATSDGEMAGLTVPDPHTRAVHRPWAMRLPRDVVRRLLVLPQPSPKRLVAGAESGVCAIVDVHRQEVVAVLGGAATPRQRSPATGIRSLAYSTDHGFLITAGWEPRPSLWLLATSGRNFLGDLHDEAAPHHGALLGVAVLPGTPLVVSSDAGGLCKLWDIRMGRCVQSIAVGDAGPGAGRSLAFAVDPARRAVVHWTADPVHPAGRLHVHAPVGPGLRGPSRLSPGGEAEGPPVQFVLYDELNSLFVVVTDTAVGLWDAATATLRHTCRPTAGDAISAAALDPPRRRVIVGTHGGAITLHSHAQGERVGQLRRHRSEVTGLEGGTARGVLISTSWDGEVHFSAPGGALLASVSLGRPILTAHLAPTAALLLCADDRGWAHLWAYALYSDGTCSPHPVAQCPILPPASPGPHSSATAHTADPTSEAQVAVAAASAAGVLAVALLDGHDAFVAADTTGALHLWSPRQPQGPALVSWKKAPAAPQHRSNSNSPTVVTSLCFAGGTTALFCGDDDGDVCVWQLAKLLDCLQCTSPSGGWGDRSKSCAWLQPKLEACWRASDRNGVSHMLLLESEGVLVTCTNAEVLFWSLEGAPLGQLSAAQPDGRRFRGLAAAEQGRASDVVCHLRRSPADLFDVDAATAGASAGLSGGGDRGPLSTAAAQPSARGPAPCSPPPTPAELAAIPRPKWALPMAADVPLIPRTNQPPASWRTYVWRTVPAAAADGPRHVLRDAATRDDEGARLRLEDVADQLMRLEPRPEPPLLHTPRVALALESPAATVAANISQPVMVGRASRSATTNMLTVPRGGASRPSTALPPESAGQQQLREPHCRLGAEGLPPGAPSAADPERPPTPPEAAPAPHRPDELCSNPEENGELLEGLSPTSRSCGGLPASPPACPSPTRRPRFRQLLERSPGWPLAASPFLTARGAAPPTPVPFLAAPGGPRPSGQPLASNPVQTAEEPSLKAAVRPPLPAGVLRAHRPSPVSPAPGEQAPLRCVGSAVQPSP